ncbi:MAG: histidine kinase [Rhodovulum sulfidophilum]|uniref:Histidine kinase n=1 Tax=Rhodovulum sulfidophilum TaxID=35806 RepID=A0A2W5N199_RHOSU|nr:MAG: histidine kinase [Rhodovulum sulfidophilum]
MTGGGAGRPRKPPAAAEGSATAQPVLLSGGNPQIAKGYGEAPVRAYIDAMPGWKQAVGHRIDALVVAAVPGVRKAVKWNSPFYGAAEAEGWFLSYHCFARYVKVTFFQGAGLDPQPPGRSKYPAVRYLDIRETDTLDEALLTAWIRQASALPGERL